MNAFRQLGPRCLRYVLALLACLELAGCIQIDGVHYLNAYGQADGGAYVMSMENLVYAAMLQDQRNLMDTLRTFSSPSISRDDDRTFISDRSGRVRMEKFYDRIDCRPALTGWSDCSYSMRQNDWTFPGWSIDWTVVVPRGWTVLDSNHDRRVVTGTDQQLIWHFDGNRVNAFDISFTVRMPDA